MSNGNIGQPESLSFWQACAKHAAHEERIKALEDAHRESSNEFHTLRTCLSKKMEKRIFYAFVSILVSALISFCGLSIHNTDKVTQKVDQVVEKINNLTIEVKVLQEKMGSQNERMNKLERTLNKDSQYLFRKE